MNLRAGEERIVINGKNYRIPSNILLFKSPYGKDAYISGISKVNPDAFNSEYIASVKIIEEDKFEIVPCKVLEKYTKDLFRKFYVNKKEYDIPYALVSEAKEIISKISKYNPMPLKEFEKKFEKNLFNNLN